ncbi:MAG: hypothetical protein JSS32_02420 [Verrucomicrobia bacterium]|nr:hypothetical protein [Verrucomicrobiota bacterium]
MGNLMRLPCVLMRGGTSKGVFLHAKDLPDDPAQLERLLLALMGSPDPRQIDGLGGADSLTSRIAIVSPSTRDDADVEFRFGLAHIKEPIVEFKGTCGNMMSGVGPFAIDEGLIQPTEPITLVRIYDINTKKLIHAKIPVVQGRAAVEGHYAISGVPGTGAKIDLHFQKPGGTITGKLLPTGRLKDRIDGLEVSIVDAIAPTILLRAADVNLRGDETAEELDRNPEVLEKLEALRQAGGAAIGLESSAFLPKIAFLSPPGSSGSISARMLTLGRVHKAYAVSCGVCTAAAVLIPGTIAHDLARLPDAGKEVRIEHPSGFIDIGIRYHQENNQIVLDEAIIPRTARRLMSGIAHIRS